ncbi:hypothetical protein TNCV_860351 [Trichonephila clavipes]|nr:hypothetical protein TNCV_860351 [Trichonephila clavipes]
MKGADLNASSCLSFSDKNQFATANARGLLKTNLVTLSQTPDLIPTLQNFHFTNVKSLTLNRINGHQPFHTPDLP